MKTTSIIIIGAVVAVAVIWGGVIVMRRQYLSTKSNSEQISGWGGAPLLLPGQSASQPYLQYDPRTGVGLTTNTDGTINFLGGVGGY